MCTCTQYMHIDSVSAKIIGAWWTGSNLTLYRSPV